MNARMEGANISFSTPRTSMPSSPRSFAVAKISSHDQPGQPKVENAVFILSLHSAAKTADSFPKSLPYSSLGLRRREESESVLLLREVMTREADRSRSSRSSSELLLSSITTLRM